jgi:hypothetical protein
MSSTRLPPMPRIRKFWKPARKGLLPTVTPVRCAQVADVLHVLAIDILGRDHRDRGRHVVERPPARRRRRHGVELVRAQAVSWKAQASLEEGMPPAVRQAASAPTAGR